MKFFFQHLNLLGFILIASFCMIGCSNDDDMNVDMGDPAPILPYNSSKHVYGTFANENTSASWEVVIDPMSGQFEKIVETENNLGAPSSRNGAIALTAFGRNERVFIPANSNSNLMVQSLESFNSTTIELRDTLIKKSTVFPQLIRFGETENEVYVLDSDNSLWKVNLDNQAVEKIHDGIPVSNTTIIVNLFYLPSIDKFLCSTNNTNIVNEYTADDLILFDPNTADPTAIVSTVAISNGFGFVQHPVKENEFFYMQRPANNEGFRLMKIGVAGNTINVSAKSTTDLQIDNLSLYLQTIHTSTNTYIMRGKTDPLGVSSMILYSIDLDTGELVNEAVLEEMGFLLKVAGE